MKGAALRRLPQECVTSAVLRLRQGVKGLGEIALTGMAPASAIAVFHAMGRRMRDVPMCIESLSAA